MSLSEPAASGKGSPLFNADLAPVPPASRTWGMWDFIALWVSMSACIPTYMLASSLVDQQVGMNWSQAIFTIFLANVIVLIPMILNAHAGTKYGIPFPVYCRASFGTLGANIPVLMRAFVACGWFGIQAWIGGMAIYQILGEFFPAMLVVKPIAVLGISVPQAVCFLFFWGINMGVIYKGIDCIRWLLIIKAPLLILLGLALLWWAYDKAGGFGTMLSQPSQFSPGQPKAGQFWVVFFPALTGMIGFWATLSLNIPDFSRYAKSQRAQIIGQAIGLPPAMALYSFIGVAVTSATAVIYGEAIWDPTVLLTKFSNPVVLIIAMLALCIATLATNIAANVVSPANDFSNLAPHKISFRTGGYITGVVGILMMPWKLLADPTVYIFTLLGGFSALLGPIGGILIADYFVCRRKELDPVALYQSHGAYRFTGGFSLVAIAALVLGVLPSLPGFLVQVKLASPGVFPLCLVDLYHYAWFVGFGLAFALYVILRKLAPNA
ncbi:MAG: NCS1 family nucleobase:cation symporter-1 [Verrucomicrobiota bacterium]